MSRPVSWPAVAAFVWAAVAAQAVLESFGLVIPGSVVVCPVRLLTGHPCPGCGMGHALVAAMRGHFAASYAAHPLGIPLLLLWTSWLAWGGVNLYRGREFSEGFPPFIRRPAFAWTALAVTLAVYLARVA